MDEGRTGLRTFWLLVREDAERPEVFTLEDGTRGAARTLPIFCFEEEALLFLRLGGLEGRWRADETGAADLATNLASTPSGAYSMVRRVVLDPFPEVGFDGFRKAVSLPREMFVDLLANPRRPQVHSPNRPAATCSLPDSKGEYLPGAGFAPNCGRRSRKRAQ